MIKKLQALKAKKGFTLVELVVVIAIIGVLAAILIPVMIGVVEDANITSANSTANQVFTQASAFFTKASNDHKASLKVSTATKTDDTAGALIVFSVDESANWSAPYIMDGASGQGSADTAQNGLFIGNKSTVKAVFGSLTANDKDITVTWKGGDKEEKDFATFMKNTIPSLKKASVLLYVDKRGALIGSAVVEGDPNYFQATGDGADYLATCFMSTNWSTEKYPEDAGEGKQSGSKNGKLDDGTIFGSKPALKIAKNSDIRSIASSST